MISVKNVVLKFSRQINPNYEIVLTYSNPLSFNRFLNVGPIPAISEISFSPIGSETKLACFFEVVDIFFSFSQSKIIDLDQI